MPHLTSYFDGCPTSHGLDLIGNRWALLVVRELMVGPKRFSDLRRSLPRISSNVLVERVHELETIGVLVRRTLPPPAGSAIYELTDRGHGLDLVLTAIGGWAAASPTLPRTDTLGVDTFVLELRDAFDPTAGGDTEATYEVRIEDEAFTFAIHNRSMTLRRGGHDGSGAVLRIDPTAMAAVARGGRALIDALAAVGETHRPEVASFASLFARPDVDRHQGRRNAQHRRGTEDQRVTALRSLTDMSRRRIGYRTAVPAAHRRAGRPNPVRWSALARLG